MRIPKIPTMRALYAKKTEIRAIDKLDKIAAELDVSKWRVINALVCDYLGIKTKHKVDLSKWCKK